MFGKFEELLIILVIILVLFGGKKLPELGRSLGESVRELRKGLQGAPDEEPSKAETEKPKKSKKSA